MHSAPYRLVLIVLVLPLGACDRTVPANSPAAHPSVSRPPAQSQSQPAPQKKESVDTAIQTVLAGQYPGGFDAKRNCWRVRHGDTTNSVDYCMRVSQHDVVDTASGPRLYLTTASASDIRDEPRYLYSSDVPGLFGAFEVALDGAQPRVIAADNGMEYGTAGACGCEHARLERIGNERHAWVFTSGGTWQGVTTANYAIVTAIGNRMADVSRLPQITEDAQDVTYDLAIDRSNATADWYPVSLAKRVDGKTTEQRTIAFDASSSTYNMPEQF